MLQKYESFLWLRKYNDKSEIDLLKDLMNEKQYLQDMERDSDRRKAKALNIKV